MMSKSHIVNVEALFPECELKMLVTYFIFMMGILKRNK